LIAICLTVEMGSAQNEPYTSEDRRMVKEMLHTLRGDLHSYYFDKHFNGIDLDARFKQAESKVESATSLNHAMSDVAAALDALNDSHTFFIPPPRPYKHSYGWEMQALGDSGCFISAVRPGSDADKKGLKVGDEVITVNGYSAIREDVRRLRFVFNTLRPQGSLHLVTKSVDGNTKEIDSVASMKMTERIADYWSFAITAREGMRLHHPRFVQYGNDLIIWKLPDFVFMTDDANKMLDQIRPYKTLILDLRGNPGGSLDFLGKFLGGMFDHNIKIGDRVRREATKTESAKSRGDKTFNGKVIVLIDSDSASASEIFVRVMQLERRGTVIGDVSSGSVREAKFHQHQIGAMTVVFYGAMTSEANLVMNDGKDLEHVGVIPDVKMVPTARDLAAGRDPVLAYAAGLAGVNLTSAEAGKLFPVEWPVQ
jgi:carboxyl-terminal processing protease